MRKAWLTLPIAATLLISVLVPFRATAAEPRPEVRQGRDRGVCERACSEDHRTWVGLCIEFHDPHEIIPSARGQCVADGAERLRQCLEGCR